MIPQGWTETKLEDVADKISDGIHSTPVYADFSDCYFINGNNLKNGTIIIFDDTKCVSHEEFLRHKKELGSNSILMSINGTIGNLAFYDNQKVILGKSAAYINVKRSVIKEFVFYALSSDRIKDFFKSELTGSTIQNLSLRTIKNTRLMLPPLAEQKKIAEILGCWDLGIEKLDSLITAKKKLKKALAQQLLTGKKRFKEVKGQEWKEVRLGDIFKQRKESGCVHLPLLAITGAYGVTDRDGMERRDTSSVDKSKYLRICPDDLGYNTMRMWQGVNGISKLEGIISPAYTVCIPDKKRVFPQFIGYLFKSHPVIFLFYRHSQGLVSDTWNLKFSHFSKIDVAIPSIEEQQKIASVLNAADEEIEILSKKLESLQAQKKGLMQKLLTGKIRVKV